MLPTDQHGSGVARVDASLLLLVPVFGAVIAVFCVVPGVGLELGNSLEPCFRDDGQSMGVCENPIHAYLASIIIGVPSLARIFLAVTRRRRQR